MTTETHRGDRGCYLRGCRQAECSTAHYRYMSLLRLDYERGHRRRVDATQTRVHIERLFAAGWTQAQVARAAGLQHRVVGAVLEGQLTVSRRTAQPILLIRIGPPPADVRDTGATGTVRRVRALVAIGWPIAQLAPRLGIFESALGVIARGERDRVRIATAERVAREYRLLSRTPGSSNRARNDARRRGWHGPLAWDEWTIDDPAAGPDVDGNGAQPSRNELAAYRREEITHLVSFGVPQHEIAARLGMAPQYVHDLIVQLRKEDRLPVAQAA
ncbi:hypothetical protein [Streptomyces niveus]